MRGSFLQLSFSDLCASWQKLLGKSQSSKNFAKSRILPRPKKISTKPRSLLTECDQLQQLWHTIALEYFPNVKHLAVYRVGWSKRRQKRTLASCCIEKQTIRVACELDHPDHNTWLEPLLYHEMCHAVLGHSVPVRNRKRCWHGPEFKKLEQQHPRIKELDSWIKQGGWHKAVRSHRARQYWSNKKCL